ncbi:MAG TPA: sigma-70 family RNA polymerase sigma factor [Thermoanaerobaculia bacterium]|nr:sigma-70 family RNA polymerase sigma factor [Thermoanaerobaculia bacterium]
MGERSETALALLDELQAGGAGGHSAEESFRRLCGLYSRPLFHFFAKRGFPREDCLDLTQETFLGIYKGVGSFRREAGFETWLWKIATNAFRKRLRHGTADKRYGQEVSLDTGEAPEGEARELPAGTPAPGEDLLREERARLLRAAIERLPEQMRRCLQLRVYRDMKYREIAVLMRLSPETVKVHLFQARKRLQQELGNYFRELLPEDEG